MYTRKQLRDITGLPDKTLRWLLDRLDIQPSDMNRTLFGSPVYLYDESVLYELHAYIFNKRVLKEERAKGYRCRGGCNRHFPHTELNSQQICNQCRRKAWLRNEIHNGDPLCNPINTEIVSELRNAIDELAN